MKLSELFQNYLNEMEEKGYFEPADPKDPLTNFTDGESALKFYHKPFYTWLFTQNYDGDKVGFVVVGTYPDCHPDCDYFIIQAYTHPEYRKQGRMTRMIHQFLKEHPGTYCLDIADKNEYAQSFWSEVFTGAGYTQKNLCQVKHGFDEGKTYFWGM